MKLSLLSKNLILILEEILENDDLLKYISFYNYQPLKNDLPENPNRLMNKKLFPTPFNGKVPQTEDVNIRVFYPSGRFSSSETNMDVNVVFQIIIHDDLWLIRDGDDNQVLRPYAILDEIYKTFQGKTIDTLGKIEFLGWDYARIDRDYSLFDISGVVRQISKKGNTIYEKK